MRYNFLPLCAVVLLAALPACYDMTPQRFDSLAELSAYQKKEGYVMVEHFGEAWPAVVLSERVYKDEVTVILANSDTHLFEESEGHKLRVIKLKGERSAEIVVVFRSEEKE